MLLSCLGDPEGAEDSSHVCVLPLGRDVANSSREEDHHILSALHFAVEQLSAVQQRVDMWCCEGCVLPRNYLGIILDAWSHLHDVQ